jgi:hypothetical protein
MLNSALLFIPLRFYELYQALLLQVETGTNGLTWWGTLLILGLVVLIVVLALVWNASKTTVPKLEHHTSEIDEVHDSPSTHVPEAEDDDLTRIEGIGPKIAALLQYSTRPACSSPMGPPGLSRLP